METFGNLQSTTSLQSSVWCIPTSATTKILECWSSLYQTSQIFFTTLANGIKIQGVKEAVKPSNIPFLFGLWSPGDTLVATSFPSALIKQPGIICRLLENWGWKNNTCIFGKFLKKIFILLGIGLTSGLYSLFWMLMLSLCWTISGLLLFFRWGMRGASKRTSLGVLRNMGKGLKIKKWSKVYQDLSCN